MIDEDELAGDGFEEVAFGEDAEEGAVWGGDWEGEVVGEGNFCASSFDGGIGGEWVESVVEEEAGLHSAAGEEDAGGGIEGAFDEGDVGGASRLYHIGGHVEAAGEDDGADAESDSETDDVGAVADEEDSLLGFVHFGDAGGESFWVHGGDHEGAFSDLCIEIAGDAGSAEGADDVGEGGCDFAGAVALGGGREEVAGEAEAGEEADAAVLGIEDGKAAEAFISEEGESALDGVVVADEDDVSLHYVFDFRGDVTKELRRLDSEFCESEFDSFVEVAGAACDDVFGAEQTLEFCVSDGGDDGVHVGVFVADDDGFHARLGRVRGRGWGRGDGEGKRNMMGRKKKSGKLRAPASYSN